jgi:predicted AAA+ superfamily ATPase
MEWYEELDFDENPLYLDSKFIGNEVLLEEAFYSVVSGNILVIQGELGSGKTKILKEVIKRFGGFGKVAYVNCEKVQKELNVEDIVKKKGGFFSALFKKDPKNMILLLDNVENLSLRNLERIKYYFDRGYLQSVIFATSDFSNLNLSDSLKQRVRKVIKIGRLSDYEAVQIVRDRIGKELLSDRVIKEAYKQSGGNVKDFLNNCEEVCKIHLHDKTKELTEKDVQNILTGEVKNE